MNIAGFQHWSLPMSNYCLDILLGTEQFIISAKEFRYRRDGFRCIFIHAAQWICGDNGLLLIFHLNNFCLKESSVYYMPRSLFHNFETNEWTNDWMKETFHSMASHKSNLFNAHTNAAAIFAYARPWNFSQNERNSLATLILLELCLASIIFIFVICLRVGSRDSWC